MAEVIFGLACLAFFCLALIGIGFAIGRVTKSGSGPPAPGARTSAESDLHATARTLRQLAEAGMIDPALHDRMLPVLREAQFRLDTGRRPYRTSAPPEFHSPRVATPAPSPLPTARPADILEILDETPEKPVASPPPLFIAPANEAETRSGELHPLDRPDPVPAAIEPTPTAPQRRRRALADVLHSFLQEKNIRWGELISGVLIVGCSIALAISLRREIASLSDRFIYLPALLFMLATAAVHAAGNYTLRRWKLRSTSRGALIIASLLIPINFLASIVVTGPESRELPPFHPLYLSAIGVGLAAFGVMAFFAGTALMRGGWWRLWVVLMGTSAGQLIVSRTVEWQSGAAAVGAIVALPLAAYLVATLGQLIVAVRRPRMTPSVFNETLLVLGVATFSLAPPIGLMIFEAESVRLAFAWLSTPLFLTAVAILATGLAIFRRCSAKKQAPLRVVGVSLALLGGASAVAATAVAWPYPGLLVAVGLCGFASLTAFAVMGKLPALHLPAIVCGALACLVGVHLLQGSYIGYEETLSRRVIELLLKGRTAVMLALLAMLVAGAGGALLMRKRREAAFNYLIAGGGLSLISLAVAFGVGFLRRPEFEPDAVTPVLALYAALVLAGAWLLPQRSKSWTSIRAASTFAGSWLALAAMAHGLDWNVTIQSWLADASALPERRVVISTLAHGLTAAVAAALLSFRGRTPSFAGTSPRWQGFVVPLAISGLLSSLATAPWAVTVIEQRFGDHAWYVAALSIVWLAGSVGLRSRTAFMVFQSLATLGVVFATASVCQHQPWWTGRLLEPQHIQIQLATLAGWCFLWSAGRTFVRRRYPKIVRRTRLAEFAIDDVVLGFVLLSLLGAAVVACVPGIAQELTLRLSPRFLAPETARSFLSYGSWIALAVTTLAVASATVEARTLVKTCALVLLAAVAAALVGGFGYEQVAVASILRWSFAGMGVALTIALLTASRFEATLRRFLPGRSSPAFAAHESLARDWTLSLTGLPIVGLTTVSLIQAASGVGPSGPLSESVFAQMGAELSFGVPLGLLVAIFVAHALRANNPLLMVAGSLAFQYLVNLGYFLPILKSSGASWDWPIAIGCLQWNALGLAAFALLWLGLRPLIEPRRRLPRFVGAEAFLALQVLAAVGVAAGTAALAMAATIAVPDDLTKFLALGSWPTFVACIASFGALAWTVRARWNGIGISVAIGALVALCGPLAIALEGQPGDWQAFHVLTIAVLVVGAIALAASWIPLRRGWARGARIAAIGWSSALLLASILLALRAAPVDPAAPWSSVAALVAATILATALGFRTRRHAFAYATAFTACAAATIAWAYAWPNGELQGVADLLQLDVLALIAVSTIWLFAEIRQQHGYDRDFFRFARFPALHQVGAVVATCSALFVGFVGFVLSGLVDVPRTALDVSSPLGWVALLAVGGLTVGGLWDRRMKLAVPALYVWGLATLLISLDLADASLTLDRQTVFVVAGFLLATFVALTGRVWRQGAELAAIGSRLRMPDPVAQLRRTEFWLPAVTLSLGAAVVVTDTMVVVGFPERWMRVAAACGPALLAYGIGCLAQQSRRTAFQYVSLTLASFSALLVAWADIEPAWRETLVLERVVRLLVVFAALAFAFAVPVARLARFRGSDWLPAIDRMATLYGAAAIAAFACTLGLEVASFEPGVGVPFGHPYQIVAVAVVSVALIIAFLAMALSPRFDRLSLSEDSREIYVYAAELVGAGLFAHIYLSYPHLFGTLKPYWPYIILGIAFAGVALAEAFQRGGVRTLARPLQHTGGLLPLLPALGWWLNPALGIDAAGHYALLLFLAGLLYATLSLMRGSYLSGIAAAVACNGALWALLADYEPLSLLKHPQTWLIPPALTTLAAAQMLRRQLNDAQLAAIRYVCLIVIYVSSTADIFIGGIGDNLWEPMALATLSVLGVFLGIGLQIRAFLYLGSTFTFLAVVSMVWHAYDNVGHVGVWWAFGIALGALILVVFGIFEKNRAELTRIVQAMRSWEP
ncbi:MAG TPA: hypothetical protein VGN57_06560 [Pirellulaceae bacterium]|jgi:hypothetical protein|nr:hypothetical protein [Pirellulaceae bacterium]